MSMPPIWIAMGVNQTSFDCGDLAFDHSGGGHLYGSVALLTADGTQVSKYSLAIFDDPLTTGRATLIGAGFDTAITGLAFVGGTLYGGDFYGNFYRIDPASGLLTLVGNNGLA